MWIQGRELLGFSLSLSIPIDKHHKDMMKMHDICVCSHKVGGHYCNILAMPYDRPCSNKECNCGRPRIRSFEYMIEDICR